MSVRNWPKVQLAGEVQVIPGVCPNCLQSAEVAVRYSYTSTLIFYRGASTQYYQTFHYCKACAGGAEEAIKHDKRCQFWLSLPGLATALFLVIALLGLSLYLLAPLLEGVARRAQVDRFFEIIFSVGIAVVVTLTAALISWRLGRSRNAAHRRQPQRPEQAVWGLAAYYTGDCVWAALSTHNWSQVDSPAAPVREYRAARAEWLRILVEANPNQADEETYARVVGTPKPPEEPTRPFPK
jgi:hypothetical protein